VAIETQPLPARHMRAAGCHDEDFRRRMLAARVRFVGRSL
jgi:hypothetical protein